MKKILALVLFYFCTLLPSPAFAAFARGVGPAFASTAGPGTTCTMTLNGTTAGRMLVISTSWNTTGAANITSVTVSGESAATLITGSKAANVGMPQAVQLAYLANIGTGGNKTVTVTISGSTYGSCGVMEYSGQDTASQPDASASLQNFDASGATSCISSITTAANSLIVAHCTNSGQATGAGSTYTTWGAFPSGSYYDITEDKLDAGTAGSEAVTFPAAYNNSAMAIAAFKISGGGGGGGTPAAVVHRRIQ